MLGNGTGPATVKRSRQEDFAIFDALPREVRDAMNGAWFNYAAGEVAQAARTIPPERLAATFPASDRLVIEKERRKAALAAAQKEARRRVFA